MTARSEAFGNFAICVLGPTASGKTRLAFELAQHFDCEIISVDSAQVYRGMDIGTAKPSADELREFPHRLIDIRDPWESYSAGEFCTDAAQAMREIIDAGRIPLLVGGTMLYFQALQMGLAELPPADAALREELDERAEREGWAALHADLAVLDPVTAKRLQPTDRQRIQRALEICLLSGESASTLQQTNSVSIDASYLNIGLIPQDRGKLHVQIARRLDQMHEAGFLAEVRDLLELPEMHPDVPALRAVGYRQLSMHLAGEYTEAEAFEKALVATRRLAKRQHTWLRSWSGLLEIDSFAADPAEQAHQLVSAWLADRATGARNS